MLNKKQKTEFVLVKEKPSLRLIVERGDDRRDEQSPYFGANKREDLRRQDDIECHESELNLLKQENERLRGRNEVLVVSKTELVLYYSALILSVNVIFGWMAYLAL